MTQHFGANGFQHPSDDDWSDTLRFGRTMMSAWSRAMWSSLAWHQAWVRAWTVALDARQVWSLPTAAASDGARVERRNRGMPWVPQVDSKVIPLRRADDPVGMEASRISWRMELPNLFGVKDCANVLYLDALMPMRAGEIARPSQTDEAGAGGSSRESEAREGTAQPPGDDASNQDHARSKKTRRPSR